MNKTKKILCLIDSLASGGAQRQLTGLASLLKREGFEVKVIAYHDIPFYLPQLLKSGVDYEYVPCGVGLLDRLRKIGRAIKIFGPDVVISYLDMPNIIACILHITNRKRWKLIVSERNTTQNLSLRERIKFALYRFADYIVPNSYAQDYFIINNYPRYAPKCNVITNFVDTELFSPPPFKVCNDVFRIIGVGRVSKQKNIPMLIKALKIVNEKDRKVRVDWYGNKFDSYGVCIRLIKDYKLEDIFVFHEASKGIINLYQQSDLFVLPSIYEGFPNVLCEAMSCGLPVIATDVCDNGRIVQNGENGYLISPNDSEGLADKLLLFMSMSSEQRMNMGTKSREIALELFSKDSFIKKYVDLID